MRILTVRQPWAWAIIHGGKDVENRVRNIAGDYRGPVAIHAAQTFALDAPEHLFEYSGARTIGTETSAIIGVIDLMDVHTAEECHAASIQHALDLYATDRPAFNALADSGAGGIVGKAHFCSPWAFDENHHLVLANPRPLSEPIPFNGALGLRRLDEETIARIEAQL